MKKSIIWFYSKNFYVKLWLLITEICPKPFYIIISGILWSLYLLSFSKFLPKKFIDKSRDPVKVISKFLQKNAFTFMVRPFKSILRTITISRESLKEGWWILAVINLSPSNETLMLLQEFFNFLSFYMILWAKWSD